MVIPLFLKPTRKKFIYFGLMFPFAGFWLILLLFFGLAGFNLLGDSPQGYPFKIITVLILLAVFLLFWPTGLMVWTNSFVTVWSVKNLTAEQSAYYYLWEALRPFLLFLSLLATLGWWYLIACLLANRCAKNR